MPVRTAYVGTEAVGDVLTKANFDKLPGGWIGYAEVTANQATITVEADLTGLTVTVTVNTNRRIRINSFIHLASTVVGDEVALYIKEGATYLAYASATIGTANRNFPLGRDVVLTPTAGSHTYLLRAARTTGTGTVTMVAAAANNGSPAYISVEDLGPAS